MYMHHADSVLLEAEKVLNPLELELLLESNHKFRASGYTLSYIQQVSCLKYTLGIEPNSSLKEFH